MYKFSSYLHTICHHCINAKTFIIFESFFFQQIFHGMVLAWSLFWRAFSLYPPRPPPLSSFYSLHFTFNTSTSHNHKAKVRWTTSTFSTFYTEHLYRVHNSVYDTLLRKFWPSGASQFNVFLYTWLCTLLLLGIDCAVAGIECVTGSLFDVYLRTVRRLRLGHTANLILIWSGFIFHFFLACIHSCVRSYVQVSSIKCVQFTIGIPFSLFAVPSLLSVYQ